MPPAALSSIPGVVRLWLATFAAFSLALAALTPACAFALRSIYTADIPARGGVKLAADIYLPEAPGTYPSILIRTPYDPRFAPLLKTAHRLASAGYAVVVAHCRGRYDSQGTFVPFKDDARDGLSTVAWVVKQPWCNGKVATMGASYQGMVQWQLAALQNPYVKAMFIVVAPADAYRDIVYPGGAFALQSQSSWTFLVSRRTDQHPLFVDWTTALKHLPLIEVDQRLGTGLPLLREYMRQSRFTAYWRRMYKLAEEYGNVKVPTFIVGGFNDPLVKGTLETFSMLKKAMSERRMPAEFVQALVGPWDHLGAIQGMRTIFGDVDYGPTAAADTDGLALAWFDHWLKEKTLERWQQRALRYFLGGTNVWKESDDWPPPEAKATSFFLHSSGDARGPAGQGKLSAQRPDTEPHDSFTYDPGDPVPTVMSGHILFGSGPKEIQSIESRKDVLTFTSDPLPHDLLVAGNSRLSLYVRSDAPDTDFSAWLCDVTADGRSLALKDGIVRASRFLSKEKDSVLAPGKTYKVDIELGALAHVFKAGERIRVDISSSNFPAFDRNLNTGRSNWMETQPRTASQIVMHDHEHPSQLILPVVEETKAR